MPLYCVMIVKTSNQFSLKNQTSHPIFFKCMKKHNYSLYAVKVTYFLCCKSHSFFFKSNNPSSFKLSLYIIFCTPSWSSRTFCDDRNALYTCCSYWGLICGWGIEILILFHFNEFAFIFNINTCGWLVAPILDNIVYILN